MPSILHIATTRYGGAGRAAYRLHEAMLAQGMPSYFLSADDEHGNPNEQWTTITQPTPKKNWWQLFPKPQASTALQRTLQRLKPQLSCEAVSLPGGMQNLHFHPLVQLADIINLHWVAGLLDYSSFFAAIHKPIVWTIHDMQPFSGIFHYEGDLQDNPQAAVLDEQVRQLKQEAIGNRKGPLHIVSPSNWLLQKALNSKVFMGLQGSVIPYSLNLDVFSALDKLACRRKLQLDSTDFIVLFVSHHLLVKRKGWQLLHNAFQNLSGKFPHLAMAAIGNDDLPAANYKRMLPGAVKDDEQLALWYGAADVVAIPSSEDNLPNVMLEALACGRPVISFCNGGMQEHVLTENTGLLGKASELETLLISCIEQIDEYNPMQIRQYAETTFAQHQQVLAYQQVVEAQKVESLQ